MALQAYLLIILYYKRKIKNKKINFCVMYREREREREKIFIYIFIIILKQI